MSKDPYRYFRQEAGDILESLTRNILEVRRSAGSPEVVNEILRLAHTLKGAAGVVRKPEIAKLAHGLEDLFVPFRGGAASAPEPTVVEALRFVDAIRQDLGALDAPPPADPKSAAGAPIDKSFDSIRIDVEELEVFSSILGEAGVQLEAFQQLSADYSELRKRAQGFIKVCAAGGREAGRPLAGGHREPAIGFIQGLENDLKLVNQRLAASVQRFQREVKDLAERVHRLSLLPASSLFAELESAVRDAAQAHRREAVFEASGGDERLDAQVLSALRNALLHVVRNAVVHGIEAPEKRRSAGKPTAGRITLKVSRRGSRICFECRDDGPGLDLESVRKAAVRQGIRSEDEAGSLGREEALRLIFRAGMTTKSAADLVSGRGVGLDVVRHIASRLKGEVEARSEAGQGMCIEIIVPVSASSIEALLVEDGGLQAAVPISCVRRSIQKGSADASTEGGMLALEGKAIPLCDLASLLRQPRNGAPGGGKGSILLLEAGGRTGAVSVDRLLGVRKMVVKPLPAAAGSMPLLSGASFDASGNPVPVLDPAGALDAIGAGKNGAPAPVEARRAPVLVIDDSLTTRVLEQTILEWNGFEVDLATSGVEGLKLARSRRYGLFLVDVEMPEMNGFEFLDRVREDASLRDIPAIMVTTRNSEEDLQRGRELGARAYFIKSEFDETRLLDTIRELCGEVPA